MGVAQQVTSSFAIGNLEDPPTPMSEFAIN
jgi:hypothetical protein